MIELYQLDSFLHSENYFVEFPLSDRKTVYVRSGQPNITLPNQDTFTHEEVEGKILNRVMFRRLLEYIGDA